MNIVVDIAVAANTKSGRWKKLVDIAVAAAVAVVVVAVVEEEAAAIAPESSVVANKKPETNSTRSTTSKFFPNDAKFRSFSESPLKFFSAVVVVVALVAVVAVELAAEEVEAALRVGPRRGCVSSPARPFARRRRDTRRC